MALSCHLMQSENYHKYIQPSSVTSTAVTALDARFCHVGALQDRYHCIQINRSIYGQNMSLKCP